VREGRRVTPEMTDREDLDFLPPEAPKGGRGKLRILAVAVLLLLAAAALLFLGERRGEPPPSHAPEPADSRPEPPGEETSIPPMREGPAVPRLPLVLPPLRESDTLARESIEALSGRPLPPRWLSVDDLIRRLVAVVDNIAEGRSPRKHLPFLRIDGSFTAVGEDGRIAIDPRSYRRYDSFAGAVDALDAEGAALLYGDFRPLFQEAYRDLGYPDRSFDETLARAIHRLLGVPVLEGDVILRKGERVYYFEDPALEGLSPAEKHLLRMGPAHTTLIQGTLRRLKAALGLDAPGP